jgi:hypothetical protein
MYLIAFSGPPDGVKATVMVVVAPLTGLVIVMVGVTRAPKMAGKVPEMDASSKMVPSLVVAAATAAIAFWLPDGRVNCAKFKVTAVFAGKLPPPVMATKIFNTWVLTMLGVHVAPAGAVTAHAWVPMVGEPESVMRMAEVAAEVMAVSGVNVTVAVVAVPLIWEPRVIVGPVRAPRMAGNATEVRVSRARVVLKVDIVTLRAAAVVAEFLSPATVHETATPAVPTAAGVSTVSSKLLPDQTTVPVPTVMPVVQV